MQSSIDDSNIRIPYLPRFCKFSNKYMKCELATGPDQIGNTILKELCHVLAESVTKLFNFCIRSDIFPNAWKRAHVIPIRKNGL